MKDHEKRELVNELTKVAIEFCSTQQLRERIAHLVLPALDASAKSERDFTECLKGKWRHTDEDGTEWGCMEVQYNKPLKLKK